MNILVTGADGQLGSALRADLRLRALGLVIWTARTAPPHAGQERALDLLDAAAMARLLDEVQPDVIINAAAYTAVDKAEKEEALAFAVNAEAVARMGRWAADHDALVIHVSTDYVFDGDANVPYAVGDATSPIGAYGRSKRAGEVALRQSGAHSIILRTAWLYAATGKNFLTTMLRLARERDELRVVSDQVGSPTPASVLASAVIDCVETWKGADDAKRHQLTGIYHAVTRDSTSWHGFAQAIVEGAARRGIVSQAPRVSAITTLDFPTPAKRPRFSVLDNASFEATFGRRMPDWEHALSTTLDELIPL